MVSNGASGQLSNDAIGADFDADGRLDLFCGGTVSLNRGFGRFIPSATQIGSESVQAAVGDFDHDGKQDCAVRESSTGVRIHYGNGAGAFPTSTAISAVAPSALVAADFDQDGYSDVVAYGYDFINGARIQLLRGANAMAADPPIVVPLGDAYLATGDFDGDGKFDLLFAYRQFTNGLYWMRGLGGGAFQPSQQISATTIGNHVTVGDLNGDGRSDAVVTATDSVNSAVYAFTGNAGGLAPSQTLSVAGVATKCILADFTLDQRLDLLTIVKNATTPVRLGNGNGTFGSASNQPLGNLLDAVPVHLDADGFVDVAGVYSSVVYGLSGKGTGAFTLPPTTSASASTDSIECGLLLVDLDNDGHEELVTVDGNPGALRVHKGIGNGTFGASVVSSSAPATTWMLSTDIDADGLRDLVTVTRGGSGSFAAHRNVGGLAFAAGTTQSISQTIMTPPSLADMDNDGDLDLVVLGDNTIYISSNTGGPGYFQPAVSAAQVLLHPFGAATTGDFDQDGAVDVVVANRAVMPPPYSPNVAYIVFAKGNGAGALTLTAATAIGGLIPFDQQQLALTRDANGDSKPDLFLYTGTKVFQATYGGGAFNQLSSSTVVSMQQLAARPVRFGDLDGDGIEDLIVTANTPIVYPGLGMGFDDTKSELLPNVGAWGFVSEGCDVADLDEDGSSDVVLRRASAPNLDVSILLNDACVSTAQSYGAGCPGSGGFVPVLTFTGCPDPGQTVKLGAKKCKGGSTMVVLFGTTPANLQIGGGCGLLVFPVLPVSLALPLSGSGNGTGVFSLSTTYPPAALGVSFALQGFVADSGATLGYAASNGVLILH